jgi:hypothetical protein
VQNAAERPRRPSRDGRGTRIYVTEYDDAEAVLEKWRQAMRRLDVDRRPI